MANVQFGNFTRLSFQPQSEKAQRLLKQYNEQVDVFTEAKTNEQHASTSSSDSAQTNIAALREETESAKTKLFALQSLLDNEVKYAQNKPGDKDKQKVEDKGFSAMG